VKRILIAILLLVSIVVAALAITWWRSPRTGHVQDEAMLAGL